ncbi:MAG TPA: AAA family ATPase [Ferruginibacter sp.]|nr:AAA family ATPase [Ferruginibacter sp.]HRO17949.1 AAA family ATPase [Ferruginibacter sp.]
MITQEQKNTISAAAAKWIEDHNVTQADLAKKANINPAYLSNILRGNYTYKANDVEADIPVKWFNQLAAAIGISIHKQYWKPIQTAELKHIIVELTAAKNNTRCVTIVTDTGLGKTYTIERFCNVHPQHTYKVTVNHMHKVRDILSELAEQMGVPVKTYPLDTLIGIAKKMKDLRMMGCKPVIIIDEGENLRLAVVQMLKGLYDRINGYASLVLIGTPQLLRLLERMRTNDQPGAPQFYRRIKAGIKVVPAYNDFTPFFQEFGITEKGLRALLTRICSNYGELHDYLEPALKEADEAEKPLTEDLFRLMYNLPK